LPRPVRQAVGEEVPTHRRYAGSRQRKGINVQGGKIRILDGALAGMEVQVSKWITVGRDPTKAQLVFPSGDTAVSRQHCEIRFDPADGLFEVRDLGSRNGTFIANGASPRRRLSPNITERLPPGQTVLVGSSHNRLVLELDSGHVADAAGLARRSDLTGQKILIQPDIGMLGRGVRINMQAVRDPWERRYFAVIVFVNVVIALMLVGLVIFDFRIAIGLAIFGLLIGALSWITWKLVFALVHGNSIEVGENQYPQIFRVIKAAAEALQIPVPTVLIMQGHGLFEVLVAKRFSRRGYIFLMSNMVDEFAKRPTSREFMMFIGLQLGRIKAGHFDYWVFKEVVGQCAFLFHWAWKRRCTFTADRIGLLVAGDLYSAERALFMITAGSRIAAGTRYNAVLEQRTRLFESGWAWLRLAFCTYPYMVDRVVRLREFAEMVTRRSDVGALPIEHRSLSALPILIIHGRDRMALLELKDFIHSHLPQIVPRVMVDEVIGSIRLVDKFERIANDAAGAIALLTPDDFGGLVQDRRASPRARQNVVIEIGWAWSKLGRERLLLLSRGTVELPSDLSGSDIIPFRESPRECSEAVRSFVDRLVRSASEA
jgi:hypothetical protein